MRGVDRIGTCLTRARSTRQRCLVAYLTMGDPLTSGSPGLEPVVAHAGADILELGIPTPSTDPRGAEVKKSFDRARNVDIRQVWRDVGELRNLLPSTPLILLIYPETSADIGWDGLLWASVQAGVDGMVLTDPVESDLARVASAGLSAIPLIRPAADRADARRWEDAATHMTYRTLGARTGEPLDGESLARIAAGSAAEATKPFLAGFGIRFAHEIRMLTPHVTGVVVGSELLRRLSTTPPSNRVNTAQDLVGEWKAATTTLEAAADGTANYR